MSRFIAKPVLSGVVVFLALVLSINTNLRAQIAQNMPYDNWTLVDGSGSGSTGTGTCC